MTEAMESIRIFAHQSSLTLLFGSLTTFLAIILVLEAPLQFRTIAFAVLQLDRVLARTIMTNCRACITALQCPGIVSVSLTGTQSLIPMA